ncbi:MAG: hypothetical protein WBB85_16355 [Albidovulum sp.]|uniref:hypothetical protein n=1 Tax=Albidovulum sp. TaxID=1872424 RepID=UPI003C9D9D5A
MIEQQNENPGATAIASGAEFEAANFKTVSYRLEVEWATALAFCLGRVSHETGAQICFAYLDSRRTEGPVLALFDDIRAEAEFWADCAPVHEVEAHVFAGMRRLGETALGKNTRKRLFAALWDSFDDADRLKFARKSGMIGGAV